MTTHSLTQILWGRAFTIGLVVFGVLLALLLWWVA